MSALSSILEGVGNVATGGWLGLIGSLGNKAVQLYERAKDREHELAVLDRAAASAEAAERWKAFGKSHDSAAAEITSGVAPWALNTRATTRPFLTYGLCAAWSIATLLIVLFPNKATPEVRATVDALGNLTGTAVVWWFGSRQLEKFSTAKK